MIQTTPNVKIIPAAVKPIEKTNKYKQLRVAAYCRVSTEQEEQQNSYNVQIAYYTGLKIRTVIKMKNIPNPCGSCTERHTACQDGCRKHKAYIKIKSEVERRIRANIRSCSHYTYKPVVHQMFHK